MSTYCYAATAREWQHCFHTQVILTGDPPTKIEYCCHCDAKRTVPAVVTVTTPAHGPYMKVSK